MTVIEGAESQVGRSLPMIAALSAGAIVALSTIALALDNRRVIRSATATLVTHDMMREIRRGIMYEIHDAASGIIGFINYGKLLR